MSDEEEFPVTACKVTNSRVARYSKVLAGVVLAGAILAPQAKAEGLAGSWSGGGTVVYSDGHREHARCRAQFSGGSYVSLEATCATPSGSVSQSARLRRTGANSYSGSFFNPQFNVSGSIHISVHGNTQYVTLRSASGSASLTLRH
jgi:hypothetical protein